MDVIGYLGLGVMDMILLQRCWIVLNSVVERGRQVQKIYTRIAM